VAHPAVDPDQHEAPEPAPVDLDALAPVVQLRKGQPSGPVHVITTLPEVAPPAPPRIHRPGTFRRESLIPVLCAFAMLGLWAWVTLTIISW
jgi:hypothetical protein